MSRQFLVPLVLPANPTNPLEAATKQYVDAAAGGTTILVGTGAPGAGVGSAGNFYVDTAGSDLYGPKSSSGFGTEQRITVTGTLPDTSSTNFEIGTKVTFGVAGRVTKIRYYRRSDTATTLGVNAWDSGGSKAMTTINDSTGSGTGTYVTVTLPTPITIAAASTYTFSVGALGNVPFYSALSPVTSTTNVTFVDYMRLGAGAGSFPNVQTTFWSFFVEPIFEPSESWSLALETSKVTAGLANVDNTSDANKPVSTAQQTALNGKVNGTTRITVATSAPSSPATGDLWVDTT